MTVFEKIKSMDIDELAKFLAQRRFLWSNMCEDPYEDEYEIDVVINKEHDDVMEVLKSDISEHEFTLVKDGKVFNRTFMWCSDSDLVSDNLLAPDKTEDRFQVFGGKEHLYDLWVWRGASGVVHFDTVNLDEELEIEESK